MERSSLVRLFLRAPESVHWKRDKESVYTQHGGSGFDDGRFYSQYNINSYRESKSGSKGRHEGSIVGHGKRPSDGRRVRFNATVDYQEANDYTSSSNDSSSNSHDGYGEGEGEEEIAIYAATPTANRPRRNSSSHTAHSMPDGHHMVTDRSPSAGHKIAPSKGVGINHTTHPRSPKNHKTRIGTHASGATNVAHAPSQLSKFVYLPFDPLNLPDPKPNIAFRTHRRSQPNRPSFLTSAASSRPSRGRHEKRNSSDGGNRHLSKGAAKPPLVI